MDIRIPPETRRLLRDGRLARIRPIVPSDAPLLMEFHERLSIQTTRLRFFTPMRHLAPEFAMRLTEVDFATRCAFVVSFPGEDAIHGVGRYEGEAEHSAELAFVVEDTLQGLGIGSILLERLAAHALSHGFIRFSAIVLGENDSILTLFREAPYPVEIKRQADLAFVADAGGQKSPLLFMRTLHVRPDDHLDTIHAAGMNITRVVPGAWPIGVGMRSNAAAARTGACNAPMKRARKNRTAPGPQAVASRRGEMEGTSESPTGWDALFDALLEDADALTRRSRSRLRSA